MLLLQGCKNKTNYWRHKKDISVFLNEEYFGRLEDTKGILKNSRNGEYYGRLENRMGISRVMVNFPSDFILFFQKEATFTLVIRDYYRKTIQRWLIHNQGITIQPNSRI